MLVVEITFEHNDNVIKITETSGPLVGGKPGTEDDVRKLVDKAKAKFIAALNADG